MKTSESRELARILRVVVQRLRAEADALEKTAIWIEISTHSQPVSAQTVKHLVEPDPLEEVKDLGDVPPEWELGATIGRQASVACQQGAHDLCLSQEDSVGCRCRCHEDALGRKL